MLIPCLVLFFLFLRIVFSEITPKTYVVHNPVKLPMIFVVDKFGKMGDIHLWL